MKPEFRRPKDRQSLFDRKENAENMVEQSRPLNEPILAVLIATRSVDDIARIYGLTPSRLAQARDQFWL